jgi:hypothetical protein
VEEREVHERRRAHAYVDDADARGADALRHRGGVAVGREAAVAPDGDQLLPGLGDEGPEGESEGAGERGVEVAVRDATDVVLPEDGGIQLSTST